MSLLLAVGAGLAGCSKPAETAKPVAAADAEADEGPDETTVELTKKLAAKTHNRPPGTRAPKFAPPAAPVVQAHTPGPGEQRCFLCDGAGTIPCVAVGCHDGQVECPGRCLKRSQGTWVRDTAHGGIAAAIKVPGGGTWFINEGHAGEVWVLQGGKMVSLGRCPTCGGRQSINCPVCKGGATTPCELCETKGVIPAAWKPADNPWFNRQSDVVRLKDGRVFLAKEAGGDDVVVMFKTRAGEIITIARDEVSQWPKKL